MGNFYVNYTLRGATQAAVAKELAGRTAIVTPAVKETVVVFDEESDSQDTEVIIALAEQLSRKLSCPVLAVLNHDDDILWYQLYDSGQMLDEYNSSPSYFDSEATEIAPPEGGNSEQLCRLFNSSNPGAVEEVLHNKDDKYVFAMDRHQDLVKALGISDYGVATAYANFERDEAPEGLNVAEVIKTE